MNTRIRMKAVARVSLALLTLGGLAPIASAADDTYRMTDLLDLTHHRGVGSTIGVDLNNFGEVIGGATTFDSSAGGTLWYHFYATDLAVKYNQPIFAVYEINDRSEAVGFLRTDTESTIQAIILRKNRVETLNVDIYALPRALNNRGEVALDHYLQPGGQGVLYWFNGLVKQVPGTDNTSWARTINNAGVICGATGDSPEFPLQNPTVAWIWANNTRTVIPRLPGDASNDALDINDHNEVVGQSRNNSYTSIRGYLWRNGVSTDLRMNLPGDANGAPMAINDATVIVGWSGPYAQDGLSRAVIWRNGTTRDLNTLIAADDPLRNRVKLYNAVGINEAGEIIAYGRDPNGGNFSAHTYFLRPTRLPNINP